jgi:hypothetical protein
LNPAILLFWVGFPPGISKKNQKTPVKTLLVKNPWTRKNLKKTQKTHASEKEDRDNEEAIRNLSSRSLGIGDLQRVRVKRG